MLLRNGVPVPATERSATPNTVGFLLPRGEMELTVSNCIVSFSF